MTRTDVTFTSDERQLAGDLYLPPTADQPVPAVVMAPGFGGVKEILFPAYAESLSEAGIAVLAFDYANFGASEGEPRQHMDMDDQQRGYRHALDYLAGRPDVDAGRLGVFGSSMSGGHALAIASSDARVRSVVVLIPFTGLAVGDEHAELIAAAEDAARSLAAGDPPQMITSHGRPGDVAVMSSDGAWEWMQRESAGLTTFRNEVTMASLWNLANYHPAEDLHAVTAPVHAVLASDDAITPAAAARTALAGLDQVDIVEFPQSHFELFTDHKLRTIELTTEWFSADLVTE